MTTTQVLAPCPGQVVSISESVDQVFAGEIVGPGVLIRPESGSTTVVAPIAGKVVKVHPHAFVILSPDGVGVLVHLGINTVRLEGAGFEVHATQGSDVAVGDAMVTWDPASITDPEMSSEVPVVIMDRPAGTVSPAAASVASGDVLFDVP